MKIKPRWMKAAIRAAQVETMALPKSRLRALRPAPALKSAAPASA